MHLKYAQMLAVVVPEERTIYKRLMGMYRWMRPHFHDWIDNNGLAFPIELLE